jgi:predicted lipoprotein with Yx(FWY)xxD motif
MSRIPKAVPPTIVGGAAIVAIALVTAACGSGGYNKPAAASGSAPATAAASVSVANSPLGQLLVDGSGRTLYLFEGDTTAMSTCSDACAQAWPPLLASGTPSAGLGANAAEMGTTTRADGTSEVTYHGHPLYTYVADTKAGDVNGQGLNQFGAKWYVLSPSGDKIDKD